MAKLLGYLKPLFEMRIRRAELELFPEKLVVESVCGRWSAREAYLRGFLNVKSNMDVFTPQRSKAVENNTGELQQGDEWRNGRFILAYFRKLAGYILNMSAGEKFTTSNTQVPIKKVGLFMALMD